ncbi:MAG TPA: hypothetical protein VKT75_08980 [Acidobacteriaceae bacterium]|nr:hypothetical protein [Acidobacteriaceae bacterium]
MSEDVSPQAPQASPVAWKKILLASAGFGAGFAILLTISALIAVWLAHRPKPWNSTAITAKPNHLVVETAGEELHFRFRYALTNHTGGDYIVVGPENAALMKKIPEDSSLQRLDGATWDDTLRIPAGQSVNVIFDVPIKLADFNTSAADLNGDDQSSDQMPAKYSQFVGSRLKEMNGLVLIDYANRYRIDLPRDWDTAK